jgi:LmbE family N-acetylglucosaminyl deacetylase
MNKVILFAAHPDDEILGVAGTIARHTSEGDDVKVVIMAQGLASRENFNLEDLKKLHNSTILANKTLGIKEENIFFENCPDNQMDKLPQLEINKKVEFYINKFKPNIVYTHHAGDLNIDHRITHEAVMTACRPIPNQTVKKILCFETLSSSEWAGYGFTPFIPNYFVNIEKSFNKKLEALSFYKSEMRDAPHSRSISNIENLAKFRGNSVGFEFAEAFFSKISIE